jgi:hypothetical protein
VVEVRRCQFDRLTDAGSIRRSGPIWRPPPKNIDEIAVKDVTALLGRVSPP